MTFKLIPEEKKWGKPRKMVEKSIPSRRNSISKDPEERQSLACSWTLGQVSVRWHDQCMYGWAWVATSWSQTVQDFTDYGKGFDCYSKSNQKPSLNLKISQGVYATRIKSYVSTTGLQVRIKHIVESDTIKSFFLLLYIVLCDNRYKTEKDQKVSVPTNL